MEIGEFCAYKAGNNGMMYSFAFYFLDNILISVTNFKARAIDKNIIVTEKNVKVSKFSQKS